MNEEKVTFEQDAGTSSTEVPDDERLKNVSSLAEKQLKIEDEILRLEERIEARKKELFSISTEKLPAAMQEIGLERFAISGGIDIIIKPFVYARMPKQDGKEAEERERAIQAYKWLEDNNFLDIVKHIVSMAFSKGEDENAQRAILALKEAGFEPDDKEDVHWKTLESFVKEQMEKGVDVPLHLFNGYSGQRTKIVRPK